ncbi:MAG TPA: hypothetical protein VM533_15995 [Fimbriiglobus sp.]|jgi:hypothetical protein|nr:hypothetical protein [Fimbriiglobus sp.]
MTNIDPFVRHMLLLDDIKTDPNNPKKLILRGLVQTIRLTEPVQLPAVIEELCVLFSLSGGRGVGTVQIRAMDDETGQFAFGSAAHQIVYPPNPLEVVTRSFRLQRCVIRRIGLYWIQFWHNGRMLADQPLIVR